ncbi:VC0807 family protein [Paenibacillus aestuarii]|uniref:VC0807 family protein n=1 Tax=Paenibacillus aestuarii TaxID=516965 RepID=A0ABW0K7I4_9BACL|nr:VC0807 family protein [Paenibacillus aestuarii]
MNTPTSVRPAAKKDIVRGIVTTLLINGALPLLAYELLRSHMTSISALSIATLIPLLDNLYGLMKHRKLDVFAVFMLFSFILGLLMITMGGSEQLLLIRESFVTAIMGIIFLGSLFLPRPLIFYFAMRFTVGNDPQRTAVFAANWKYQYFRFVMRLMTAVWGIALLGEALVRTILVYRLTVTQFLALSNFVMYGFIGAAIIWTIYYRRHSQKKLREIIAREAK